MGVSVADILNDIALVSDLISKITSNIAAAKGVLSASEISDAKAKLAAIQAQGAALDAEFDAALEEATK